MHEDVKKILEAGNQSPSGENCQPWKFIVKGFTIQLYSLPERNQSLYGWGQRDAYIANGAVIENMSIAAREYGYNLSFTLFPDADKNHIASIVLEKNSLISKDPLFSAIEKRTTNRKPYKETVLTDDQINQIVSATNEIGYGKILLTQDKDQKKVLGKVGGANEIVMLSNKNIHNFFFSHINWTKEDDDKKKIGFYIETLELPPPAKIMFKLLQHWSFATILNKIGFHKAVGKQNGATNAAASAIGIIVAEGNEIVDFVKTGMVMQRMWLRITSLGLSLQPLTGVIFFMLNINNGEKNLFSAEQIQLITQEYKKIETIFNSEGKTILFMFRVGYGGEPTARSSRFDLETAIELQ